MSLLRFNAATHVTLKMFLLLGYYPNFRINEKAIKIGIVINTHKQQYSSWT